MRFSFLLLFLAAGTAFAEPNLAKQKENFCRASGRFNYRPISDCKFIHDSILQRRKEIAAEEAEASEVINGHKKINLDSVNADSGAQCALAKVFQYGISRSNRVDVLIADAKRDVLKNLKKNRDAELELDMLKNHLASARPCLECRAERPAPDCVMKCDEFHLHKIESALLGKPGIQMAKTLEPLINDAKQEQARLKAKIEEFSRFLQEKKSLEEEATKRMREQRTEIHKKYRCPLDEMSLPNTSGAEESAALPNEPALSPGLPSETPVPFYEKNSAALPTETEKTVLSALEYSESRLPEGVEKKMESATKLLAPENNTGTFGTGFFVKSVDADGNEKYEMITARHVTEPNFKDISTESRFVTAQDSRLAGSFDRDSLLRLKSGDNAEWSARLDAEPGNYDRANDVVKTAAPAGAALEVAPEGDLPKEGDKFLIGGYPGAENLNYTVRSCTFQGYAPAVASSEMQYLMDCPSSGVHQGGASGGPLVRESDGKVFGVVSRHTYDPTTGVLSYNRVVAAPLYQSTDGKIQIGSQQQLMQTNCYRTGANGDQPYACSILPGLQGVVP